MMQSSHIHPTLKYSNGAVQAAPRVSRREGSISTTLDRGLMSKQAGGLKAKKTDEEKQKEKEERKAKAKKWNKEKDEEHAACSVG